MRTRRFQITVAGGALVAAASIVLLGGGPSGAMYSAEDPPYCPTNEEILADWNQDGLETKADPNCPDPDPLPAADPTNPPETEPPASPGPAPTSIDEAQRILDPDNEPLVLLAQASDGSYYAIVGAAGKDSIPPASVRTVEQYAAWLAKQARKEGK